MGHALDTEHVSVLVSASGTESIRRQMEGGILVRRCTRKYSDAMQARFQAPLLSALKIAERLIRYLPENTLHF